MKKQIQRRDFIKSGLMAGAGAIALPTVLSGCKKDKDHVPADRIITVTGTIATADLGIILPHEHVMSAFGGDQVEIPQYDTEKLFAAVVPYLKQVGQLGCSALFDCTTAYFGRAPALLQQISKDSGVALITNTGYYGAADDRYIPPHAFEETAAQLAERWINEWHNGIADTGIKPGFIKTGVDNGPLSDIDAKLIRASAKTHLESGLTIAAHSGDNPESVQKQLDILAEEGVSPAAWVWVHANKVKTAEPLLRAAEKGAWIELDGVNADHENNQHHLALIKALKNSGYANHILLSHDGNSFRLGDRPPKAYDGLFTTFMPLLKEEGFSQAEIDQLVKQNPGKAFAIQVREA